MAIAQYEIGQYLEVAHALAASVAEAADRIDRDREIPSELIREIADKGLFRMLLPRSLGGGEIDFLDYLRIIEIFAKVDASTAWCMNQNNVFATNSVRMPEQTAREIWSDQRAVVTNGPPATSVEAIPVDGGYQLTGRWDFSTGIRHATWVAAITPIRHIDHGEE
ncbi:MAG: acyl-CoA dehydrogenase family protein, partial [Chloroflexi bacterium]|nr:acyl-CoA dehydrogenase family protein [Chloroflexota bacterium]